MKKWNFISNTLDTKHSVIGQNNESFKNYIEKTDTNTNPIFINHAFNPLFVDLQKKFLNLELFFRIDDVGLLPTIAKSLGYKIDKNTEHTDEYASIIPNFQEQQNHSTQNPATAYIPISTWCNQFCAFCIVPYARGLEKYFPVEKIIEEAKIHLANGAKEIILLGQIVNKHPQFKEILTQILELPWLERLRYTSPYPSYYTKEIFDLHQKAEKLCPHIHIPLQSWSNKILKKMFRGYTAEQFKESIDNIKELKRPISITTDIIVWFPDEDEIDFSETLELTKYAQFDMIYIGIYSPRKGTYAEQKIPDNVPYATKHKRRDQLNNLLIKLSMQNNKAEEWQHKKILIDSCTKSSEIFLIQGHTENMKTVERESSHPLTTGTFTNKTITKTQSLKLYASDEA